MASKTKRAGKTKPGRKKTAAPAPIIIPKLGRPSAYTAELGQLICERLADGKTLTSICKNDDSVPHVRTVRKWALDPEHDFHPLYTRARELGFHTWADETVDISDDGSRDYKSVTNEDGSTREIVDQDHIQRSRLRVETRKWMISKVLCKIYGDRISQEITGADGGPIEVKDIDKLEVARHIAYIFTQAEKQLDAEQERGDG